MSVKRVFVAGSGLMGGGIAQVCAQAGLKVDLYDQVDKAVDKALKTIEWSVGKFHEKGKLTREPGEVMGLISKAENVAVAGSADLVIEAVYENIDVKKNVFESLNPVLTPGTLVASNSSAIPTTELAAFSKEPENFLGLHFFSPVPMMQALEVIKGARTSDEAFEQGREFALAIGKEPIMVNRDVAGFVINRINFPSTMEAMRLVEQGVASVEDIDKGLRLGAGRKMGIFETGDMVGLDVTLGGMTAMFQETGDPRWHPPMILKRKVTAGQLGRKTGVGWYRYDENGKKLGPAD